MTADEARKLRAEMTADWKDQDWLLFLVAQTGAKPLRKVLEAAGYRLSDVTGRLIAKRGNCEGCAKYALLQVAGGGRFLCAACTETDFCEV